MKREDIEKAAFKFGLENQVAPGLGGELRIGFVAGAEWRINSVWHDASELPKSGNHVTVIFQNMGIASCYYNGSPKDIEESFKVSGVVKWAYSTDLLPNMEDEK